MGKHTNTSGSSGQNAAGQRIGDTYRDSHKHVGTHQKVEVTEPTPPTEGGR